MTGRASPPSHGYCAVNALRALETIACRPSTIPQLAGQLQQKPVTTRRLVYRLEYEGHLERTGRGLRAPYALGTRAHALGALLVAAAKPPQGPWREQHATDDRSH